MKFIVWVGVAVILGLLSTQLYRLYKNNGILEAELNKSQEEVQVMTNEAERLKADISYFSEPDNLAKELKAKFDYKKPGEKLIKVQ